MPTLDVRHELRWSTATMACSGLTTLLLYALVRGGWTRLYFDAGRYGWGYFALSVVIGIVGYDTWYYWEHRLAEIEHGHGGIADVGHGMEAVAGFG